MSAPYNHAGLKTAIVAGHVPEDVARELAEHARAHDRTVSAEVRIAVREYLSRIRERGNA